MQKPTAYRVDPERLAWKTFRRETRRRIAMLAGTKDSVVLTKIPGTAPVDVTVTVTAADPVTGQPVFSYQGITMNRVPIITEKAEFTLVLRAEGFPPDFQVTFAPIGPGEPGPITWRTSGPQQQVARPDYITEPVLSQDSMTLTFTVTNTATHSHVVLISFTLGVLVAGPDDPSGQTFESPDPTIINVDPPDSTVP
jgi:hypothetical protein